MLSKKFHKCKNCGRETIELYLKQDFSACTWCDKKFETEVIATLDAMMGITEMRHEQDVVTPYGTRDEYGGL